MNRHRWAIGIAVTAVVAVLACSQDAADPGYYLVKHGQASILDSAQAVDSATRFMVSAGCAPSGRATPVGTIRVPVPAAGRKNYDCHLLSKDSVHRINRSYRAWMRAWVPGEHLTELSSWDVGVTNTYLCNNGLFSYSVAPGENYQVVRSDGSVFAEGVAGPNGEMLFAECSSGDLMAQWIALYYDDTGNLTSPQPVYSFDTGGGGGGGGDGGSQTPPPTRSPYSVSITPGSITVSDGDFTPLFHATVTYSDQSTDNTVTWLSLDPTIAVIDDAGAFHAIAPGTATITATSGTAVGSATITVMELDDSTTTDEQAPSCTKDDRSGCVGHNPTHDQMNQIRNAITGIVFTQIPYCATVKQILQSLDSLQIWDAGQGPTPNDFALSGWHSLQTDSVARAQGIGLGLYSVVWSGNPKHSFAQTLVHEILHPLLKVQTSGLASDAGEKQLDAMANRCVINHH